MPRPTPLDSSPHGASGAASGFPWPRPAEPLPMANMAGPALQVYLMRMLDEIDYGLMLLDADGRVWHANHVARVEFTRGHLLCLNAEGHLAARDSRRQPALTQAFKRATGKGVRSMVNLLDTDEVSAGTCMAFVPMGHPAECYPQTVPVLGITCRQVLCEQVSLRFFAQSCGLTPTEEAVLQSLVQGLEVEDIVRERRLAMSTVRSHVKQLRIKTQSNSMRELLNKVSVLPPVVSSVRSF